MKTQKTNSKLCLKKETISRLDDKEMGNLNGGDLNTFTCPTLVACVPNPTTWH